MSNLAELVHHFYAGKALVQPGDRLLVAVSGGPDSMALAHATAKLREPLGMTMAIGHFDHGLRPESAEDAQFVRAAADELKAEFHGDSADVAALAKEEGLGVEEEARRLRYDFLEDARKKSGSRFLAVAHNQEDQAETLLLRLLRGSGPAGLSAMRPVRGRVIRPLLGVAREQILEYCRENEIAFLEDSTNVQPVADRNRLRLRVMPELRRIRPGVDGVLARSAEIFAQNAEVAEWAGRRAFESARLPRPGAGVEMWRSTIRDLPAPVAALALRHAAGVAAEGAPPDFAEIEAALDFARADQGGGKLRLAPGLEMVRGAETLLIQRVGGEPPAVWGVTELPVPGRVDVPGLRLRLSAGVIRDWERVQELKRSVLSGGAQIPPTTAVLDFSRVGHPLAVRGQRKGDTIIPFGHSTQVAVSDFLAEKKVPPWDRQAVPLVVSPAGIVWAAGVEIDDRFRVSHGTRVVLRLRLLPEARSG